jgi:hypothetical protein
LRIANLEIEVVCDGACVDFDACDPVVASSKILSPGLDLKKQGRN